MLKPLFAAVAAAGAVSSVVNAAGAAPCTPMSYGEADYTVCEFSRDADIRLYLRKPDGDIYGNFDKLAEALNENGERLVFAMNAGMYHKDRSPVGLYIEAGEKLSALNTNDGPGNFHLKPNGVFWVWVEDGMRGAHVARSQIWERAAHDVMAYATQSGPMLVIDGETHPRFLPKSTSRKIRNGVGLRESGDVVFVKSETPVTFYEFALLFRDALNADNALYLDGAISRLYAPNLQRNDDGFPMGPIVGVVEKPADEDDQE